MVKILYEDNHLLILEKPAGVATQSDLSNRYSLEEQAKEYLKITYNKPGEAFAIPIHRLDKCVSGIVIFAKTSKALSRLNEQLRARTMIKTYTALIEYDPIPSNGTLIDFIVHDSFKASIVSKDDSQAKQAILHYQLIGKQRGYSCLNIILETGRYHQIRAQLANRQWPIIGDKKYGSTLFWKENAIALQHSRCELIHPITKKNLIMTTTNQLI